MTPELERLFAELHAAQWTRHAYADRLAEYDTPPRCTACHRKVAPRPQFDEWGEIVQVFPLDDRERCPDCAWMER